MAKVRTARDPGMYADGNGLYLRVDSSGSRRWVQRITIRGKRHKLGLSEDTVTVHPQPAVAGAPGSTVGQQNSWVYTFRRDRMETEGIDPYHAKLFKVSGASMDPILPDGATILVDDGLTNLADGGLFLVESDGTLLVKQAQLAAERLAVDQRQSRMGVHPLARWDGSLGPGPLVRASVPGNVRETRERNHEKPKPSNRRH